MLLGLSGKSRRQQWRKGGEGRLEQAVDVDAELVTMETRSQAKSRSSSIDARYQYRRKKNKSMPINAEDNNAEPICNAPSCEKSNENSPRESMPLNRSLTAELQTAKVEKQPLQSTRSEVAGWR